jgi:membrane protein CcdC involved in cytochrome C biogenesis
VILAKLEDFKKPLEEHNVNAPPVVFIALGAVVFIIAFFGCCGAVRESYCMTTTVRVFFLFRQGQYDLFFSQFLVWFPHDDLDYPTNNSSRFHFPIHW